MSLVHMDQSQKGKEGAEWRESQIDRDGEWERIKNEKKTKGRPVQCLLGSHTSILLTWKNE